MKKLKLLNNKYLPIFLILLFFQDSYSNEPIDIWNLEKQPSEDKIIETENIVEDSIIKIKSENNIEMIIEKENLSSKNVNVAGIYDPSDNDLSIDMWVNSNGKKILEIINKIQNKNLSNDASDILNITLLTNSYFPEKNITIEEFLKTKSDWLIKQGNLDLIEIYLEKNKNLSNNSDLIKYYVDFYLSRADVSKSCEIFEKLNIHLKDNYLTKFNIYCLINLKKNEEAQLKFDLLKEDGFEENFFENRFAYLIGYEETVDSEISEKSLLDFHLSHRTNSDFKFEPNTNTSKLIWKYLSASNLLESVHFVDLEDKEKIFTIEEATHEKNYKEEELFVLYERFLFNVNQLLTVNETYKLLPSSQGRALLYQSALLNNNSSEKIKLIKLLKDSFVEDNIEDAFDTRLVDLLSKIDKTQVPSNYSDFYKSYLENSDTKNKKIKFNNKIIHQSKLLNYFKQDYNKNSINKDLESLFKKIKKDKKYFFSTKDMILLESLKSDGFLIPEKYENIYNPIRAEIPYDIQILINKEEKGLALLRLVEIIGEDKIIDMGPETIYFITTILNELNFDKLRNKILLKVLPLKV